MKVKHKIPGWLKYAKGKNEKSPVWFIDVRGTDFSPASPRWQEKINKKIRALLKEMTAPVWKEPVLIKCHIGEPRCRTRMLPEFCISTVEHFRSRGMRKIVTGDTTVAYQGERGYHENRADCGRYLTLAERHGWAEAGPLRTPFVVLDRPETSRRGIYHFRDEEVKLTSDSGNRFKEVYLSGGLARAGTIVNHVHLTLHDMAQVACAVKGLTMGGSSYKGKLIMHKCYSPVIDEDGCLRCGTCSLKCPEGALLWEKGRPPRLREDLCIGCGECIAVCHGKSISMSSTEIEDWLRGGDTLPSRMADYIIAMMEGRWNRLLNIVHLYNVTRKCDCVDKPQKSIVDHIGFLVGRNPFAVDLMSTYLLHDEVYKKVKKDTIKGKKTLKKSDILQVFFAEYHGVRPYVHLRQEYGIVTEPEPIVMRVR